MLCKNFVKAFNVLITTLATSYLLHKSFLWPEIVQDTKFKAMICEFDADYFFLTSCRSKLKIVHTT